MTKRLRKNIEVNSGKISVVDCLEESFHALRVNLFSLLPIYYLGVVPFIFGMIYFINDMCQRSDAKSIVPEYAFILALLFLWKNFFQTLFCGKLMDKLTLRTPQRLTINDYLKIILYQGIVQPIFLFINICSMLLFVTLPFTTSFFTTFTAITGSERVSLRKNLKKSFYNTLLFPGENNLIFYILMILAFMTILNCAMIIFILPWLLKTFLGIESFFSKANSFDIIINLIFNSTFWSVVLGLTYLFIDPIIKTAYTIRMFYSESIFKGFDILASLQQMRKSNKTSLSSGKTISSSASKKSPILLILIFIISITSFLPLHGKEKYDTKVLNNKIENVLNRREYSWKLPPEVLDSPDVNAFSLFFKKIFDSLTNIINAIEQFIEKYFPPQDNAQTSGFGSLLSWLSANSITVTIILSIIILLSFFIFIAKRRKNIIKTAELADLKDEQVVDLHDENISADTLKDSEWLKLATELIAKGELKLAIRAMFLGSIATLAEKDALSIAKYKTNIDYFLELKRRHHSAPNEIDAFYKNLRTFESIWYGNNRVDLTILKAFKKNFNTIEPTAKF